jgi:hypothetical protein
VLAGAPGASVAAFRLSLFLYGCAERNIKAFYKKKEISLWIVEACGVFATDIAIDSSDQSDCLRRNLSADTEIAVSAMTKPDGKAWPLAPPMALDERVRPSDFG